MHAYVVECVGSTAYDEPVSENLACLIYRLVVLSKMYSVGTDLLEQYYAVIYDECCFPASAFSLYSQRCAL